jgi:hypothetical protein
MSPNSAFSSVINSLLPIGAGLTANRTHDKSSVTEEKTKV